MLRFCDVFRGEVNTNGIQGRTSGSGAWCGSLDCLEGIIAEALWKKLTLLLVATDIIGRLHASLAHQGG